MKLDCPMYSKQKKLKDVYSWNKIRSLKSLAMLKCQSRTSLHAVSTRQMIARLCFDVLLLLF